MRRVILWKVFKLVSREEGEIGSKSGAQFITVIFISYITQASTTIFAAPQEV